jgi:hypothetical protein
MTASPLLGEMMRTWPKDRQYHDEDFFPGIGYFGLRRHSSRPW